MVARLTSQVFRPARLRAGWLVVAAALALTSCSKLDEAMGKLQPGKAFLDSQIPPGLSPQYFPPQGFVWGAFRASGLPEARYGVASPPVNPKAQVLILADADYPAEVYFELAQQLMAAGYGVWILEAPGQGGAGHYLLQNGAVFTPNYHDGAATAEAFIRDIVHPSPDKPLFVVGTGYSSITSLALSAEQKDDSFAGYVAFAPYLGGVIDKGKSWHRDDVPPDYWGGIGHAWQSANPDLRLRIKSDSWQKQMHKAYSDLDGLHLPVLSLKGQAAAVLVIEPKTTATSADNQASALCAHLNHCHMQANDGPRALGADIVAFIQSQLPAEK